MKTFKEHANINVPSPEMWKQMHQWYVDRTNFHITTVQAFCERIANRFSEFEDLRTRAVLHDQSKLREPEKTPYIYISWKYRCKDKGWDFSECNPPENIDELMANATHHHVTTNSHHPEFHSSSKISARIFDRDRDDPSDKKIDATSMAELDIAEMCADWLAMSKEKGTSAIDWADRNVNVRWMFTPKQAELIYKILKEFT